MRPCAAKTRPKRRLGDSRIRAGKRCGSHQKRGRKDHGERADPTFHTPPLSALALTASPDASPTKLVWGESKAQSGSRHRCHSCAPSGDAILLVSKCVAVALRRTATRSLYRTNVARPPAGRRAPPVRAPHVRDAEGCHYWCRVSGGGSVVLVDEASEPVAPVDLVVLG
jgi:hypothetical protein